MESVIDLRKIRTRCADIKHPLRIILAKTICSVQERSTEIPTASGARASLLTSGHHQLTL